MWFTNAIIFSSHHLIAEESLKRRVEDDVEEAPEVPEKKSKVDEVEEVVEPEEATA